MEESRSWLARHQRKERTRPGVLTGLILVPILLTTAGATCPTPGVGRLNFESLVATNAVAITPDGARLLALDAASGVLVVFDAATRSVLARVPVGLEPVSVAVHPTGAFAYVANHVSDSLSVVDLTKLSVVGTIQEVVPRFGPGGPNADAGKTLFDEPAQVVFSPDGTRAYVTLTQMNQVAVIDTASHAVVSRIDLNGTLQTPLGERVFLDGPRALAMLGNDYLVVGALASGNHTEARFTDGYPTSCPSPSVEAETVRHERCYPGSEQCLGEVPIYYGPQTAQICQGLCQTPLSRTIVSNTSLPDRDLVVVRVATGEPIATLSGVASVLYGLAVVPGPAPGTWSILFTHTDARNLRLGIQDLEGRPWLNRLSQVSFDPASGFGSTTTFELDAPLTGTPDPAHPAAVPYGIAANADGSLLYVTASASSRVLVVDGTGAVLARIPVGAHPTAIALNPTRSEVYAVNRLDRTVSVIDVQTRAVAATPAMGLDPFPVEIAAGARVVHDASLSANGSFACVSCHPGAEMDQIVWDLDTNPRRPQDGARVTQTLRGLAGAPAYHWDARYANLRTLVMETVVKMGTAPVAAQGEAAESYLLSIPHYPAGNRLPSDHLSSSALRGMRQFWSHSEPVSTLTCASSRCHTGPTLSSSVKLANVRAASLRALYDRRLIQHDGVTSSRTLTECQGDLDGEVTRKSGLRSYLDATFATLNGADEDGVIDWLYELSTGLPGVLGRQVTLTESNRTDPEVVEESDRLWREVDLGKVLLTADGSWRATSADPWAPVHMEWDRATQSFCAGSLGALGRPVVESQVQAGNAIVTYTARLSSLATESSPPVITVVSRSGVVVPDGRMHTLEPTDPTVLTLGVQGTLPGVRIFANGARFPDVPFPNDPVVGPGTLSVALGDLRPFCGQVFALQIQNPDGLMSNEVPIAVAGGPRNDPGPVSRTVCAGHPVTIGAPGLAGLLYNWSPAGAFVDPSLAVQTFTPTTSGTFTRSASIPATACVTDADVVVTVAPTGSAPGMGGTLRLVRRGADIEHHWVDIAGTSATTLSVSSVKQLTAPVTSAVVPNGVETYAEIGGVPNGARKFYFVTADACQ